MTSTNTVVANAIKARTVRNSVEVEISPGYAARVQYAMRDAVRGVSGVRMTSTNTLECRDEDAADEVIDILKQAGVPAGEVWTNANAMANATYKLSSTEAKVGDKVRVAGALGTYVVTKVDGEWIEIKDADDGTPQGHVKARFATPVKNACGTAKNAARNADNPHDIDAHGKKLVKGDWVRFLRDLPDVKKGECALVKYALPGGLIFSTLAGAREVSWDASVVEKMPPIPRSLSEVEAWKKGPRA